MNSKKEICIGMVGAGRATEVNMNTVIEAIKVSFSALGYLFLTMLAIFSVLVIVKKIGRK